KSNPDIGLMCVVPFLSKVGLTSSRGEAGKHMLIRRAPSKTAGILKNTVFPVKKGLTRAAGDGAAGGLGGNPGGSGKGRPGKVGNRGTKRLERLTAACPARPGSGGARRHNPRPSCRPVGPWRGPRGRGFPGSDPGLGFPARWSKRF